MTFNAPFTRNESQSKSPFIVSLYIYIRNVFIKVRHGWSVLFFLVWSFSKKKSTNKIMSALPIKVITNRSLVMLIFALTGWIPLMKRHCYTFDVHVHTAVPSIKVSSDKFCYFIVRNMLVKKSKDDILKVVVRQWRSVWALCQRTRSCSRCPSRSQIFRCAVDAFVWTLAIQRMSTNVGCEDKNLNCWVNKQPTHCLQAASLPLALMHSGKITIPGSDTSLLLKKQFYPIFDDR